MTWAIIDAETNEWLEGPLDDEPEVAEGQRAIEVAHGFPNTTCWSQSLGGFIDLPPGATDEIGVYRHEKWQLIKAVREKKLLVAPTPWGDFDADDTSLIRINGRIASFDNMTSLGMSLPETITWKRATNDFVSLTVTEFRQLGLIVADHIADTMAISWQLEAQIAGALTREELEAIQWPF